MLAGTFCMYGQKHRYTRNACFLDWAKVLHVRDETAIARKKGNRQMDLYLLRHGETDWNRAGLLQGHTDIPLNEKGRRQICETVQKLSDLKVEMDQIFSSPLHRACESARIAAEKLGYPAEDIVIEPMLIERGFGSGEGMTLEERNERFPDHDYPGMESQRDLVRRAGEAFRKITDTCADAENILLVAHGAVLFAVLEAVSEERIVDESQAAALTQGSIYRIRYAGDRAGFAKYDEEKAAFVEADTELIARSVKIYL